jgi:hypothetical protein
LLMQRIIFFSFGCCFCFTASAQHKAKAIAYTLTIDMETFDPVYYEMTEADEVTLSLEVDAYYNDLKLRTVARVITKPVDYQFTLPELFYDLRSTDEHLIDHEKRLIITKKGLARAPKLTGRKKNILGFKCREYRVWIDDNLQALVYVASKLKRNICPFGNLSLNGTMLEMITSNGLYYKAIDFSEGELALDFFELPADYQNGNIIKPDIGARSK